MRYAIAILGLLLLIATLGALKGKQIANLMAFGKQAAKSGPPPESVSSERAVDQEWEGILSAVGTVTAVKGVIVTTESPGVVKKIHFDSGETVKKGEPLVEIDTSVEQAQLASARARKSLANVSVTRSRALVESRSIAPSQLDTDTSAYSGATADVHALEAQIGRKIIRAAFDGRLGIREVNLGQYLAPGTAVTMLEQTGPVFVDFTLPQQSLPKLSQGMAVRIELEAQDAGAEEPIAGSISAIEPAVDPMTRTIKVRAAIPNERGRLRSGMFVNVSVILPEKTKVVAVPATSIVHAPYGDSVFVIENDKDPNAPTKVVRQQFIRTGDERGDFVAALDGVRPGQEVVSAGAFKLHNGVRVLITQDVKPKPELSPHPPNR